ncbi:hypothetical protein BS17DRAFT_379925 [Gyrodon lividus]|nr:hypothetical protein BS17DRAFT_379925 [Gyrodon lividus]
MRISSSLVALVYLGFAAAAAIPAPPNVGTGLGGIDVPGRGKQEGGNTQKDDFTNPVSHSPRGKSGPNLLGSVLSTPGKSPYGPASGPSDGKGSQGGKSGNGGQDPSQGGVPPQPSRPAVGRRASSKEGDSGLLDGILPGGSGGKGGKSGGNSGGKGGKSGGNSGGKGGKSGGNSGGKGGKSGGNSGGKGGKSGRSSGGKSQGGYPGQSSGGDTQYKDKPSGAPVLSGSPAAPLPELV